MSLQGRHFADTFEREHGCTLAEWRRELPGAAGRHRLQWLADTEAGGRACIELMPDAAPDLPSAVQATATLQLHWTVLPPRQIALVRLPRLHVAYRFSQASSAQRSAFMARFDLYLQRGGG